MISLLTRDLPIDGPRACVSRPGPAFHGADVGLGQIPFTGCARNSFDVAWLGRADSLPAKTINHRPHTPRSMPHGQIPHIIKPLVQQLVSMKRRDITRRQPPQDAVDHLTPARADRAPSIDADEETVIVEHGGAHGPRAGTAMPHRRTIHVGAISEIERHRPDIAELGRWSQRERSRITASSRSISRS